MAAAQFVDAFGSVHSAHLAVVAALRHGSAPWPALGMLLGAPGVRSLAASAYRWVADHRYAMPGSTPACAPRATRPVKRAPWLVE